MHYNTSREWISISFMIKFPRPQHPRMVNQHGTHCNAPSLDCDRYLQEKTKIVTKIYVTIPSQIMFSDEFVTEFSSSQYSLSLHFVTKKNSVTKFCDGFLTKIRQKIVMKIVSVTKNSVVIKVVFVTKL